MTVTHKRTFVSVVSIVIACLLAACETAGPKTAIGGLGGAAAGGLLGAAVGGGKTGIAAGVLLGGLLGGTVGNLLDAADRRRASEAAQRALETAPSGTRVAWNNPDSGNSGTVTPTRTYQTESGSYCRELEQSVIVGGEQHTSHNTACRQPDGNWVVVN
jgi:surface antigen